MSELPTGTVTFLEIILTNGYVKKQQKVDAGELDRARKYKKDWEERQ